jgi:hypothetical protein
METAQMIMMAYLVAMNTAIRIETAFCITIKYKIKHST